LLWSVNPKTDAKKSDQITIGAILWLDDDESDLGTFSTVSALFGPGVVYNKVEPSSRSSIGISFFGIIVGAF
jgi:hypothetical protein